MSDSLRKPDIVDLVTLSPDGTSVLVYLVATEPWDSAGDRCLLLQAKLKNYVGFVADGQLHRHYPENTG